MNVPLMSTSVLEIIFPEPPCHSRIHVGSAETTPSMSTCISAWELDIADDLWVSPSCFLFRPAVQVVSDEGTAGEFGPMIQVLTRYRKGTQVP